MVGDLVVDKITLVFALVEVVKSIDNKRKLENYYPVFSIVFGWIIMAILTSPDTLLVWQKVVIMGLVYGLSASGFYSQKKAIAERKK